MREKDCIFWLFHLFLLVSAVSLVSVVSFRSFRWFRFGRFVSLFRVLVHAVEFHVLPYVLVYVCFLVEFDLLFAFSVLSLDCASLFIYVHEHDRLCFPMSTEETAVFDCICWLSSSRERKGQSYPVEYCLESVEEYSEYTIHKGEPEPRKGNVNTVYFINQARANTTRISRTEFICEWVTKGNLTLLFFTRE